MLWYQKSRGQWVQFENINTKFFHTHMIFGCKCNIIEGLFLQQNGMWCSNDAILKNEATNLFFSLFQDDKQPKTRMETKGHSSLRYQEP